MSARKVSARPARNVDRAGAEPVLERLDLASEALVNLSRLCSTDEDAFRSDGGWAAVVEVDGTSILVIADQDRWSIHALAGADEADATLAARKLHGLLGEQGEGWDLDR